MIPHVALFTTKKCPICFALKWRLRAMKFEGIIRLTEVDVGVGGGHDLFDRYRFFINHALGGSAEVPVVLLEQINDWDITQKRSKVGAEISNSGVIEESVIDLVKRLSEKVRRFKPVPEELPSHECMVEQMIAGMEVF